MRIPVSMFVLYHRTFYCKHNMWLYNFEWSGTLGVCNDDLIQLVHKIVSVPIYIVTCAECLCGNSTKGGFQEGVDSILHNADRMRMAIPRICDIHIIGLFTSVIYRVVSSSKICEFI